MLFASTVRVKCPAMRLLPPADVKSERVQPPRGRFIVSDSVCCLENMLEDAESVVLSAATRCN